MDVSIDFKKNYYAKKIYGHSEQSTNLEDDRKI